MDGAGTFLESPGDTREEIMRATYLALCSHGYADLTIQRIADEFPKSKSLIYHHYDGKDELLLEFLEFMVDRFEDTVPYDSTAGAAEQLETILDHVFRTPIPDDRMEFATAMVELRAQAAHDDRYRDHFTRTDQFFRDRIASIIETGIDTGEFDDVDATAVAGFLVTVINGSMTEQVTSGVSDGTVVRAELDRYLTTVLDP